jgi:hypothetical protein
MNFKLPTLNSARMRAGILPALMFAGLLAGIAGAACKTGNSSNMES